MTKKLELAQYDYIEVLEDEIDVLERFNEYDGSTSICDAITEIADAAVSIYPADLWKNAYEMKEYIEEAMSSGLCETPRGQQPDLDKIFAAGYYEYYSQLLYNNESEMYYNYIANIVNKWIETLNYEQLEKLDIDELDACIEHEKGDIDSNSYMEELEDIAKRIIAGFKGKVNKNDAWENHGDADALDQGGIFIRPDEEQRHCYYVVKVDNLEYVTNEDKIRITDMYVDISDDWFDWAGIEAYSGTEESDDDIEKVLAVVDYHGAENFNPDMKDFEDKADAIEYLANMGIAIEEA
ncbi:hypothetical protein FP74_gp100 [Bacillus phage CAM003]|uniref:Uncharacterized protein n=3 Tax=Bastillevirus TaxID=1918010 RepID=A0A143FJK4_9CAUD|nr:hypothetical protein FP73_gp093 [Bacillus phage Hoody T]YP_009037162.1 hypothetical protein FP74_gp100 [Bacillus phage CAM003]AHZ09696.1 hypothetical protein [Bacillus phage CAM003]AHZ10560.1 hypothetical protein [Bacillus phage Hoody T]AMW62018.1 hypothetical protein DNAM5_274 [Bacillus phage Vinny]